MNEPTREGGTSPDLTVRSGAFAEGTPIPRRYTCDGENVSPPLAWDAVPVETKSFALICDDPDAPRGTFVHWVLFNLPADTAELGAEVPRDEMLPSGARQGRNGRNETGYTGPCPPSGAPHRYRFTVYALDTPLSLDDPVTADSLHAAMQDRVLGAGTLMGTYQRAES